MFLNIRVRHRALAIGVLLTQFSALSSSIFFLFFKAISQLVSPFLATYCIFFFALIYSIPFGIKQIPRIDKKAWNIKNFLLLIGVGLAALIGNAAIIVSLKDLPPSTSQLIQRSETIFAMFIGILFLSEKGGKVLFFSGLLFIGGIFSLHYDYLGNLPNLSLQDSWLPFLFSIGSALSFSLMQALTKILLNHFPATIINLLRLTFLVVFLSIGFPSLPKDMFSLPAQLLIAFAGCALVGPFLGRLAYMKSVLYVGVARSALFVSTGPVFTLVLQSIFFNYLINRWEVLGSIFLLIAVSLPAIIKIHGIKIKHPFFIK